MSYPLPERLRVLLIDDDEEEYFLTRNLLSDRSFNPEDYGQIRFRVDWVDNYADALAAFYAPAHDVYLVDYFLGEHDGLELLRQAVALGCRAPLILMTGKGSYDLDLEAMRAGASDYINKGEVTAPLLERTIRYAIERKHTEEMLWRAQNELELRVEERTAELLEEITERRRVEVALEGERRRLFSVLDQLPAFVYLQAPDYTHRFANCQFREIFGEPQGKFCYQVISKRQEPCEVCPTFQVFQTRRPEEWEISLPDGRSFQVFDYPFTDMDGSPLVLELGIDVTQRKEAEAGLEQRNQELQSALQQEQSLRDRLVQAEKFAAMGRMVASVAHELNNPLQTIKNCLFLVQGDAAPTSPAQEYLSMAYSETQRLSNLVRQLRELHQPAGVAPRQPVDMARLLEEVCRLLTPCLAENKVRWRRSGFKGQAVFVEGVADQLKQVFLNIGNNAIEAMQPAGGQLAVKLLLDGSPGEVGVQLKDSGPGIPPENLSKIFEPFYTSKPHGLGLGLAICFEIVARHGGRIQVSSSSGKGACFTVWLPLLSPGD